MSVFRLFLFLSCVLHGTVGFFLIRPLKKQNKPLETPIVLSTITLADSVSTLTPSQKPPLKKTTTTAAPQKTPLQQPRVTPGKRTPAPTPPCFEKSPKKTLSPLAVPQKKVPNPPPRDQKPPPPIVSNAGTGDSGAKTLQTTPLPQKPQQKAQTPSKETVPFILKELQNIKQPNSPQASTKNPQTPSRVSSSASPSGSSQKGTEDDLFIKEQIGRCWNLPLDNEDVKGLKIAVRLTLNKEGAIQKLEVLQGQSSLNHRFYKAGLESVLRALKNPLCFPLKLPVRSYALWQTVDVMFCPEEMERFF